MRMVKLGEIATVERRGVQPDQFPANTVYLGLEHIEKGGRILEYAAAIEEGLRSTKFQFTSNHVLYGKLRPYLAKIALPDREGICSTDILPVLPGPELDRTYLAYYLRQGSLVDFAASRASGANLPRLSARQLEQFPVPVPPLDEQRRIAAILDKADAIRTKRRQVLAHLDLVATAVTAKILEDRSWTSVLSAYAAIQIGPFGSLLHKSDYIEGGIPVINPVHIKNGVLIPDSKFSISEDKASELSLYRLLPGDVVMGRRGEMGRAAVVQEEHRGAVCGTGSLILRPRIKPSEIIHAIVTSPRMRSHLERSSLGATLPNLNASIVNNAPVPDLDERLTIRFSDTARSMKAIREKVDSCSTAGEELFASLQSRAFKGEL